MFASIWIFGCLCEFASQMLFKEAEVHWEKIMERSVIKQTSERTQTLCHERLNVCLLYTAGPSDTNPLLFQGLGELKHQQIKGEDQLQATYVVLNFISLVTL